MQCRLVSSYKNKTIARFESPDETTAKKTARKKGLIALVGAIPSITVTFQKYNERIHDWIDFGEIKGCL